MSSQFPRANVLTRQRLLSDDLNNGFRLVSKGLILAKLAAAFGDDYLAGAVGKGGVIGGFLVRCLAGSNTIEVSPGIALVAATPSSATYDPPAIWIELAAATTVDLTASIDPGNPRLVTIELVPVEAALVTTVVDIFDPTVGTFTVNPAAARVLGSDPTIAVSLGAASAAPVVATGTPGRIPIAVVKLTAGQLNFADQYASVLMCRPLLSAGGGDKLPRGYVYGGGCSVGEESGGAIVNLTNVYLSTLNTSLSGVEAEVAGLIPFATIGRTPDTTDTATLLLTAQPVYGYAANPPWADDYGELAQREAWQRNPNGVAYASAQNVVGGVGPTFSSLSAETTNSPGRSLRNAVVIWDVEAPYGLERGAGNAPLQVLDARGPHPDTAPGGAGSITLDALQDPTWGATQEVIDTVYIGAVSVITGVSNFMAQTVRGRGVVQVIDIAGAGGRRPQMTVTAAAAAGTLYPGRYPAMLVGNPDLSPATTQAVYVIGSSDVTGGNAKLDVREKLGQGFPAIAGSFTGAWRITAEADVADVEFGGGWMRVGVDSDNACDFDIDAGTGGTVNLLLAGIEDAILAAR